VRKDWCLGGALLGKRRNFFIYAETLALWSVWIWKVASKCELRAAARHPSPHFTASQDYCCMDVTGYANRMVKLSVE
jgi:hypothetical protein